MAVISYAEARNDAVAAGFTGQGLDIILAIAQAESGLNTTARNGPGDNHPPSLDRGILQINSYWHSEVTDAEADDPAWAFKWAYTETKQGADFHEWSTYTSGVYKQYLPKSGTTMVVPWLAPGAEAISEFARQSSGTYLHATCVETAALEDAIAQDPAVVSLKPGQIGDYLQKMVTLWRASDPNVTTQGASGYWDATTWLRGLGFRVDENVFDANWWQTLQQGLQNHQVFLVGVTNAQGLPGDEAGVHNHGLAALGIDSNGNIICGDPDNWKAQVNMPGNPIGVFVTYTQQDFINGHISSLTRVYPKMSYTKDSQGDLHYPNGVILTHLVAETVVNLGISETPLCGETYYSTTDSFTPFDGGTILTVHKDTAGNYTIQRNEGGKIALAFFQNLTSVVAADRKEEAAEAGQTTDAAKTAATAALVTALQNANLPAISVALGNLESAK